ncbi:hypothetical protein PENSPDRAFT_596939 [Peniophora sp. CONT]|nr:hypothetical protein PENSPDRAFT_596939 [Peniophora sp. CONT]
MPDDDTSNIKHDVTAQVQAQAVDDSDRASLVTRARQFLLSPQIQNEDEPAKRRFLQEKGLSENEIGLLLQEQNTVAAPSIPPRTYPRPPPSNLPVIMAGVLRIMMWGAGAGAVSLLIYHRLLLPRLTRSANARRSLKLHQRDLLSKLTTSAQELRETQRQSFAILPQSTASGELPPYADCKSVKEVLSEHTGSAEVPPVSLLRCALIDLGSSTPGPTTDELYAHLYDKIQWLEGDAAYQERLWQALNENPRFSNSAEGSDEPAHWSYVVPPPPPDTPTVTSIENLASSLKTHSITSEPSSYRQHTLQALADFTGYLTTQTYSLASSRLRLPGVQPELPSSQEEDVRKEIRALKGLVLNRKSFLPSRPVSMTA